MRRIRALVGSDSGIASEAHTRAFPFASIAGAGNIML
jgi:hypothetical protein